MKKQELVSAITNYLAEMRFLLEKAKIHPHCYETPPLQDVKVEHLRSALAFLEDVYTKEYREARKVRDLCKEEIWAMMELRGERNLREVVMLRQKFYSLAMRFTRQRPAIFIREEWENVTTKQSKSSGHSDSGTEEPSAGT